MIIQTSIFTVLFKHIMLSNNNKIMIAFYCIFNAVGKNEDVLDCLPGNNFGIWNVHDGAALPRYHL